MRRGIDIDAGCGQLADAASKVVAATRLVTRAARREKAAEGGAEEEEAAEGEDWEEAPHLRPVP